MLTALELAAVNLPCASTVKVGIVFASPYEPAVTAVLSRLIVIVSVAPATELNPVPPAIVSTSKPEVIDWIFPLSPPTPNDVEMFAKVLFMELISSDVAMSEYEVPLFDSCHLSDVSFQRISTLLEVPLSTSIPASADGDAVTLELRRILLS